MWIVKKFRAWRQHRKLEKHIRWLRAAKITLEKPHHSVERNKTMCV